MRFSRLAYLNLAHCERLQSLPELRFCATSSSGGRYFKMVSGSHNHRSGLYIFNCPLLQIAEGDQNYLALSWLMKLVEVRTSHLLPNPLSPSSFFLDLIFLFFYLWYQNPCHFRCGLDIVVPGYTIPPWFRHQFLGNSIIRITDYLNEFDNWLGFAFCVAFMKNGYPTTFGSSHYSSSSQWPYPLHLSFESEQMKETFDMPLRLVPNKVDGSNFKHLWLIYISRPHCHFVTTGAHITFKANPDVELKTWGLRVIFEHEISSSFKLGRDEVHQEGFFHLVHVHHSSSS